MCFITSRSVFCITPPQQLEYFIDLNHSLGLSLDLLIPLTKIRAAHSSHVLVLHSRVGEADIDIHYLESVNGRTFCAYAQLHIIHPSSLMLGRIYFVQTLHRT